MSPQANAKRRGRGAPPEGIGQFTPAGVNVWCQVTDVSYVTHSAQCRWPDPMRLLHDGVPLTLLLDLADRQGPRSADIYALEGQRRVGDSTSADAAADTSTPEAEQVTDVSRTPNGIDGNASVKPKPCTGSDRPAAWMPVR